jgi:hypothetical protein
VTTLKEGDSIAGGIVRHIRFDALDYEVNGKITRVAIGQNLAGGDAVVAASATTQSSAGGGDVLERLRQRRLQELGGKK